MSANRTKFLLCRSLAISLVASILPLIILCYNLNRSDIISRIVAVPINGTISTIAIVAHNYTQQCPPANSLHRKSCNVTYYNADISVNYLSYSYQYLLYDSDHTLDYVYRGIRQHAHGTNVSMYYSMLNPQVASLHISTYINDVILRFLLLLLYCGIARALFYITIPKPVELAQIEVYNEAPTEQAINITNDPSVTYEFADTNLQYNLQPLYIRRH